MTEVARLAVTVGANIRDLETGLRDANQQTNDFARRAGTNIRRAAVAFTGGSIAIAGAAFSAYAAWEDSFANVRKTVDGTPEELSELEEVLRSMATSQVFGGLENAHAELAGIAALAGQLGVETSSIDEFTESIAALTVASNLSGEAAATFAARFANVTGMDIEQDIDNLADVIVTLGNNMAANESDIASFAANLASLSTFNWSVDEILGYSAALASLDLSPELGSSNLLRTVTDITNAVANGTPDLEAYAAAAGMAVDEFAALSRSDPEGALTAFIEGLSGMDIDSQLQTLQELGITSSEQQRVLLTLASGYDTVAEATDLATEAWQGNGAAMEEATAKSETSIANINRLKSSLRDLGITFGESIAPGVNTFVNGLNDITSGNYVTGLQELAVGFTQVAGGLVGLDNEDIFASIAGWSAAGEMLGTILSDAFSGIGSSLQNTFFNIKQTIDTFFLDMQISILGGISSVINALPQELQNIPGLDIGIDALEITLDQAELDRAYITMADTIGELMNNATGPTDFSNPFGLANYLTLPDSSEIVAQLDPTTLDSLRADVETQFLEAWETGDQEALEVLTEIAATLEMYITNPTEANQEVIDEVEGAEYNATAAIDITLTANSIDMTAVQGAINAAMASATSGVTDNITGSGGFGGSNSRGNATTPIDGPFHTGVSYYQAPPGQNEGLAVLREGEAVLTPGQMRSRGQDTGRGNVQNFYSYGESPRALARMVGRATRESGY